MAELPPLSEASRLCASISGVMHATAYLDYREPTVPDIAAFDEGRGGGAIPDPLLTAHRMSRFYLVGAGDFVHSVGQLLALKEPMVVSPAVLARSAAEYSSRALYISGADDSPDIRLAKLCNLFREGYNDLGVAKPDADPQLVELSNGFNDWKSTQDLPKVPLPNYSALVHALSPTMGRREYQQLSGIAHASAVTLSSVFLLAQMGHEKRIEDSWRHALFATQCGVLAASNVCYIRDGDKTAINSCLSAFFHYERRYNQYLWDLSTERGFNPAEPRP